MRRQEQHSVGQCFVVHLDDLVLGEVLPDCACFHVEVVEADVALIVHDDDVLAGRVPRKSIEDDATLVAFLENDLTAQAVERLEFLVERQREHKCLHWHRHDARDAEFMDLCLPRQQEELVQLLAVLGLHNIWLVNVHVALRVTSKDGQRIALTDGEREEPQLLWTSAPLVGELGIGSYFLPDAVRGESQELCWALIAPDVHETICG
mmetsp:Transcript_61341/g.142731  ORF Transcript_61341/g.142731 Transcript_61341/m.142731 type:complete len:207 (+) Transcript_61341:1300-1920(+)